MYIFDGVSDKQVVKNKLTAAVTEPSYSARIRSGTQQYYVIIYVDLNAHSSSTKTQNLLKCLVLQGHEGAPAAEYGTILSY